jgi:nucleotide-binding universal stress UspA family protein
MKILIGYDGSECADGAIDDLRRAGLPADAEARVLTAAEVWPNLPADVFKPADKATLDQLAPAVRKAHVLAQQALADARATAQQGVQRVTGQFKGWKVAAEVVADAAYRALVTFAERWPADLVVVGSHGRTGLGRVLLGSVSQQVLTHAPCAVRVARCAVPPRDASAPVRIIVGWDNSPHAAHTLKHIAAREWPAGSEARLITVVDVSLSTAVPTLAAANEPIASTEADELKLLHHTASRAAERLSSAGLRAAPVLIEGDPKQVLIAEAENWDADCIVVGAKGLSRLERFLLGSVSTAVAMRAPCSVEVVRMR